MAEQRRGASRRGRLLALVLSGAADCAIRFQDLRSLLLDLGFAERVRGSHHIYTRPDVEEIINLRPLDGGPCKTVSGAAGSTDHREVQARRSSSAVSSPTFKYEVIIYWSEDDEEFIAEMPELPGRAADGKTQQEALVALQSVAQEWIETARELGRPVPQPKGRLLFA